MTCIHLHRNCIQSLQRRRWLFGQQPTSAPVAWNLGIRRHILAEDVQMIHHAFLNGQCPDGAICQFQAQLSRLAGHLVMFRCTEFWPVASLRSRLLFIIVWSTAVPTLDLGMCIEVINTQAPDGPNLICRVGNRRPTWGAEPELGVAKWGPQNQLKGELQIS